MSSEVSLSIAETNKLRKKLGLALLPEEDAVESGEKQQKPDAGSSSADPIYAQTESREESVEVSKMRKHIARIRRSRLESEKLKGKGLGDESSGEDEELDDAQNALIWVQKDRVESTGGTDLVKVPGEGEKEQKMLKPGASLSDGRSGRGLHVSHDKKRFREGENVILTLKDTNILDDEKDVLENVNITEHAKSEENVKNRKKSYYRYKPYEDEVEMDGTNTILPNFDKSKGDEGMRIVEGAGVDANSASEKENAGKGALKIEATGTSVSKVEADSMIKLELQTNFEGDYYTASDLKGFKRRKSKDKKGRRKRRKAGVEESEDVQKQTGMSEQGESSEDTKRRPTNVVGLSERHIQARRLADAKYEEALRKSNPSVLPKKIDSKQVAADSNQESGIEANLTGNMYSRQDEVMRSIQYMKEVEKQQNSDRPGVKLADQTVLDDTFELMSSLAASGSYGGVQDDVADERMPASSGEEVLESPMELDVRSESHPGEDDVSVSAVEIAIAGDSNITENRNSVASVLKSLRMRNELSENIILDGRQTDVKKDKITRKQGDVELEFKDKDGRLLTKKEAYRHISHAFHGNQPGKGRMEKRWNRIAESHIKGEMKADDTPLGSVEALKGLQKATHSPFVTLSSGSSRKIELPVQNPNARVKLDMSQITRSQRKVTGKKRRTSQLRK